MSSGGGLVFLGHTESEINAAVNNSGGDIIDRIDELVDESLSRPLTQRSGYDNNIHQDLCPHCGRAWHGLPITQMVARMYSVGRYDETYSVADDDTEIVCQGSDFIGPMKHAPHSSADAEFLDWWSAWVSSISPTWADLDLSAWCINPALQNCWWRCTLPTNCEVTTAGLHLQTGDVIFNFHFHPDELFIIPTQSDHPTQIAVLTETPPEIGVTWEPLTAPGVTDPPADLVAR